MQYKSLALFAAAASAAALPKRQIEGPAPGSNDKFSLVSIYSGSDIQNTLVSAYKSNIYVGGAEIQDASCDKPTDTATFVLNGDELFLYSTDNPPQQMYVDRSWMGQTRSGFITGAQPPPRNAELKGWSIGEDNQLLFDGASAVACRTTLEGNAWSVFFTNAPGNPGFETDCLHIHLQAVKVEDPISCTYSS